MGSTRLHPSLFFLFFSYLIWRPIPWLKVYFYLMFSHWSSYFIFPYREVEDFARRLNSVWPERMQELFQGRKLVPISLNGNSSMSRYTSRFLSQVSFILVIDAPSLLGFIASIHPPPPLPLFWNISVLS